MSQTVNGTGIIPQSPNIIRGGCFSTNPWQRGTSFANPGNPTALADKFIYETQGPGRVTISRGNTSLSLDDIYSPNCLAINTTTAEPSIATNSIYYLTYRMEGYDTALFCNDTFTFSFKVQAFRTGTYAVTFYEPNQTLIYVATYTILQSNTPQKVSITIPRYPFTFTPSNAWQFTISFIYAAGSTYSNSTINSWTSSAGISFAGQTNAMQSTSDYLYIDQIKIDPGKIARPYFPENVDSVLEQCQRYYTKTYQQGVIPSGANVTGCTGIYIPINYNPNVPIFRENFPVTMRAAPSVTLYSTATSAANRINISGTDYVGNAVSISNSSFIVTTTTAINANLQLGWQWTASADF